MRKNFITALLILLLVSQNESRACRCIWNGPFLEVAKTCSVVALVKPIKFYYNPLNRVIAADYEIIEMLKGNSDIKSVKVWGDDGKLCRSYISAAAGQVTVMALQKSDGALSSYGEKPEDYNISICGEYSLGVQNDSVKGLITGVNFSSPNQTMELSKFIQLAKNVLTTVDNPGNVIYDYSLVQNYPNPFNPATKISYSVKEGGIVRLKVYNILGEEIKTLVDGFQATGNYSVDYSSENLPGGIYFYRIEIGNTYRAARKMMLLK